MSGIPLNPVLLGENHGEDWGETRETKAAESEGNPELRILEDYKRIAQLLGKRKGGNRQYGAGGSWIETELQAHDDGQVIENQVSKYSVCLFYMKPGRDDR